MGLIQRKCVLMGPVWTLKRRCLVLYTCVCTYNSRQHFSRITGEAQIRKVSLKRNRRKDGGLAVPPTWRYVLHFIRFSCTSPRLEIFFLSSFFFFFFVHSWVCTAQASWLSFTSWDASGCYSTYRRLTSYTTSKSGYQNLLGRQLQPNCSKWSLLAQRALALEAFSRRERARSRY